MGVASGSIGLQKLGGFIEHENTAAEYSSAVAEELVQHHVARIERALAHLSRAVCYVVGMGGVPRSIYRRAASHEGVAIVWNWSVLPLSLKWLAPVIASQAGLIKILRPSAMAPMFLELTESSMAGVYVFDESREERFVSTVRSSRLPRDICYGLKDDPTYFCYVVDGDSHESQTGIYEIVSYGRASPMREYF